MDDPIFAMGHQLAAAIRQRHISAVEVVEMHLAQIARHNPALNAIVTLDADGARKKAQAADAALAHRELWGPLHGVPFTLEDLHATTGVRSTWGGYPALADHIPSADSTVAARLKGAGAILLGKTNGPASWDESVFGPCNNPWDLERTPGGSSAGPAAAVAAGLSPLDIGTDVFGSIQEPAHFCGIFGMRPTQHRVPLTGTMFLDPVHALHVMEVVGPMARSVADLRQALQIIAGADGRDADVPPVPWRAVPPPSLHEVRIAWTSRFPAMPIAEDIAARIEALAGELDRAGACLERCLPAFDFDAQVTLTKQLFDLILAQVAAFAPGYAERPPVSLDDYCRALYRRDAAIATWEDFFSKWDVLLAPVHAHTAPRHCDQVAPLRIDDLVVPDHDTHLLDIARSLSPLTGCPTVVIPCGQDRNGLPIGVQVMGRRWDDERVLAIADLVSEVTGGFQRPPGY